MQTQQTPIAFSGNIPVYYDSFLGPMFFELAIEDRGAEKLPLIVEYLEKQISNRFGAKSLEVPMQARVVSAIK